MQLNFMNQNYEKNGTTEGSVNTQTNFGHKYAQEVLTRLIYCRDSHLYSSRDTLNGKINALHISLMTS